MGNWYLKNATETEACGSCKFKCESENACEMFWKYRTSANLFGKQDKNDLRWDVKEVFT